MRTLYNETENDIYLCMDAPPKKGWTIVSDSPQGRFFISEESRYHLTKDKDDAATFEDYENALAMLEDFKERVFIETKRQEDIIHFMRIEKIENL